MNKSKLYKFQRDVLSCVVSEQEPEIGSLEEAVLSMMEVEHEFETELREQEDLCKEKQRKWNRERAGLIQARNKEREACMDAETESNRLQKLWKGDGSDRVLRMKQALAACAYWAACGLHTTSNCSPVLRSFVENILKESKEYAESEPGRDSNVMFEGFEYSYTPAGGFPESEKEIM